MDARWKADCKAMDDEALLTTVRTAPTGEALDAAWREALERAELPGDGVADALLLPEELTSFQRRVAEALAARAEGDAWTCRIPGTLRLVRRWLGMTPASVLDRRVPWTHEGHAVSWPLWRVWSDVPRSSLEHGQGPSSSPRGSRRASSSRPRARRCWSPTETTARCSRIAS
jgi:hypothetical protein